MVALVHGVAEHSGRYRHLVPVLNAAGFHVYGFDLRGHGRSRGRHGHIGAWSEYRDDLAAFLDFVRAERPGLPVLLFGHSMGALIVLDCLLNHRGAAAAAVVSGTPIRPASVANPVLIAIARMLSRVLPAFPLPIAIRPSLLSRDPDEVRAAIRDPLCHARVTARWATEILGAIDRVKARAAEIETPLLVLHGGADRLNSPEGSRWLHDHVSSRGKSLIIYEGAYHEVHNDLCRARFAADATAWLLAQVDAPPPGGPR